MLIANSYIKTVTVGLVIAVLQACAGLPSLQRLPDVHGKVLHETNDTAIEDAVVVVMWRGKPANDEEASTLCYHVRTGLTDGEGRFHIQGWRPSMEYQQLLETEVSVYAYKADYRTSELSSHTPPEKNYIYYLTPVKDIDSDEGIEQRLRDLQRLVGQTSCDLEGDSKTNLDPLYEAIVTEADKIAKTDAQKHIVERIRNWHTFVAGEKDKSS